MKLRTGFVSNSSSQSFIVRGKLFKIVDIVEKIGAKPDCYGQEKLEGISDVLFERKIKLSAETTRNPFWGEDTGEVIIGKDMGCLEDGIVRIIKPESLEQDKETIDLMVKLGILSEGASLDTFVYMLSNDNI